MQSCSVPPGALHNNNPFTLPRQALHLQRTCVTIVHTPRGDKHPFLPLLQWDNLVIVLARPQTSAVGHRPLQFSVSINCEKLYVSYQPTVPYPGLRARHSGLPVP